MDVDKVLKSMQHAEEVSQCALLADNVLKHESVLNLR